MVAGWGSQRRSSAVELSSLPLPSSGNPRDLHIQLPRPGSKEDRPYIEQDEVDLSLAGPYNYPLEKKASIMSYASTTKSQAPLVDKKPAKPYYTPSIKLLYALSTRKQIYMWTIPGLITSAASAAILPYITIVIGQAFDSFARYLAVAAETSSPTVLDPAKKQFIDEQLVVFATLSGLAVGSIFATWITLALWNVNAEITVRALRRYIFADVGLKSLEWFDLGMGMGRNQEGASADDGEGGSSAGLTGRYARDTDAVRIAVGQSMGTGVQLILTGLAAIIVCLWRSWDLTLVILATLPLVLVSSAVVERFAAKYLEVDRIQTTSASGRLERAVASITTVKAFNAEKIEANYFLTLAKSMQANYRKLAMAWGLRLGIAQFLLMASFVQGFWYGSTLVNSGKLTPGQVTQVFWGTLVASNSFQAALPSLNVIEAGKLAMAALLNLLVDESEDNANNPKEAPPSAGLVSKFVVTPPDTPVSPTTPTKMKIRGGRPVRDIRRIQPEGFTGEMSLHQVTFHYPTRPHPHAPVLSDVDLFLPARETTFIVGQSGSGKSTVGALLMGMYRPDLGQVELDEQGLPWLDDKWVRSHIAMVSQGASVIFDGTIHDNVAIGAVVNTDKKVSDVPREKVVEACRMALVHEFINDLPDGYDTWLSGEKGASLSGGQRQRLAIARAFLRDPTVLILDEATSALDTVSRVLVYEAIKRWRANKTTIVITHDLMPITPNDFVYVLRDGKVVEQGFREELDKMEEGWFHQMATLQARTAEAEDEEDEEPIDAPFLNVPVRHSWRGSTDPSALGVMASSARQYMDLRRQSSFMTDQLKRKSSYNNSQYLNTPELQRQTQFFENLFPAPPTRSRSTYGLDRPDSQRLSGLPSNYLESSARSTNAKRAHRISRVPKIQVEKEGSIMEKSSDEVTIDMQDPDKDHAQLGTWAVLRRLLPLIPNKWLLAAGFGCCVVVGITTPMFSFLLSQMLATLGTGAGQDVMVRTALLILLVAVVEGFAFWLRYTLLQWSAMGWVNHIRHTSYLKMMSQDKKFYDETKNSPFNLANICVKDVEDARNIVGMIAGQVVIVAVLVSVGLTWALVAGWQLSLIGAAILPFLVLLTGWQAKLIAGFEFVNKRRREDIVNRFHAVASNIKAIRAMSLEGVFVNQFETALELSHKSHIRQALWSGAAASASSAGGVMAQAIMFLAGAFFIRNGLYTFQQMLQVFTLIAFTVSFAATIMGYVPAGTRSAAAACDLQRLYDLSEETQEAEGRMTYPIKGAITFDNVTFTYPSRPTASVLSKMSFKVGVGECVAIVGASGSGKSTITALMQRLYEPNSGQILLDGRALQRTDVHYLRDHIAVVSQHPALFDMSVHENIAYGTEASKEDVQDAARLASAHEFILQLPHGYETNLGENAGLVSGGQAQRIAIARAILRQREVLILDECTSALDPENQAIVMSTIANVKNGRTTLIVTHKLDLMRMCDRLLVIEAGEIVESGTYEELRLRPGGVFAKLASAGEWAA